MEVRVPVMITDLRFHHRNSYYCHYQLYQELLRLLPSLVDATATTTSIAMQFLSWYARYSSQVPAAIKHDEHHHRHHGSVCPPTFFNFADSKISRRTSVRSLTDVDYRGAKDLGFKVPPAPQAHGTKRVKPKPGTLRTS